MTMTSKEEKTFLNEFACFILSHGRPDKVRTFKALKKAGYTGRIYIVIDNEDKYAEEYKKRFGADIVIVFDKLAISKTFDTFDNFHDKRGAVVFARNACFEIAKKLDIKYFIQLDDDYLYFEFRFDRNMDYKEVITKENLNGIFYSTLKFYKSCPCLASVAFMQGGDFIGGKNSTMAQCIKTKRKAMNTFICSIERPFQFVGRINEDVNTYTSLQAKGLTFLSFNIFSIKQEQTQKTPGGMTELYLDSGTYIKSFYTIICHPSASKIKLMGPISPRLHHSINWNSTAPKIVSPDLKKSI